MNLKTWVIDRFRDDVKHEEIAERERHSAETADRLKRTVELDGFGYLFSPEAALDVHPKKHRRKGALP